MPALPASLRDWMRIKMDESCKKPTWLTIMENGSIGEARTKALLLDRFWVLERSVDIEGADFIVQRRAIGHKLNSSRALFGLVQAKFLQDANTKVYISPDYLLDERNQARDSFFLIAHTGIEDGQSLYFLTAQQVIDDFKPVAAGLKHAHKYKLEGAALLLKKYELSRSHILGKIEQALDEADALKNRQYFKPYVPVPDIDAAPVLMNRHTSPKAASVDEQAFEYLLASLNDMKEQAAALAPRLADLADLAQTLKETTDPVEAACIAGKLADDYWNMPKPLFSIEELNRHVPQEMANEALGYAFQKKIEDLQLQQAWSALVPAFRAKVAAYLENSQAAGPVPAPPAIRIDAHYDAAYCLGQVDFVAVEFPGRTPYVHCYVAQQRLTIVLMLPPAGLSEAQRGTLADSLAERFSAEFQRAQVWSYKYTL